MTQPLRPWTAHAPNLPEHADNPVHTDEGAREAGYPAAIVAGTTVYALMTHPPASGWGLEWVARGGAEVRFLDAVLADEAVECRVGSADGDALWRVEAVARGSARATCDVWLDAERPVPRDGEELEPVVVQLADGWAHYGRRAGDDLALYSDQNLAHPAAWPCLANRVFSTQLVRGPWIHVRSRIAHLGAAPDDATAVVTSRIVDRFETRMGRRAVVDCLIEADGVPVCAIEHEAIVEVH